MDKNVSVFLEFETYAQNAVVAIARNQGNGRKLRGVGDMLTDAGAGIVISDMNDADRLGHLGKSRKTVTGSGLFDTQDFVMYLQSGGNLFVNLLFDPLQLFGGQVA